MSGFLIGSLVVIFIIIIIKISSILQNGSIENLPTPNHLDIYINGVLPIVKSLERALSDSYVSNVKKRVLMSHPKWKNHEFEWTFFELKRYFIMTSILKSVPMFSTKVDDIWHEMLMFTREYEKFSKDFYHETLHHTPNMDRKPIPGERAYFDWMYLSLFKYHPNNRVLWGKFLQNPIKREILEDFSNLSIDVLHEKYFRNNEDWLGVKRNLISKMKSEIRQSEQIKNGNRKLKVSRARTKTDFYNKTLGAAVYYSIYEEDQFHNHMRIFMGKIMNKTKHTGGGYSGSGSSCFSCSSSSDHHHSGGDSGGSSCSSCGGGCSS